LDDLPIAGSRRLLVQINSTARPTGWNARQVSHESGPALEVTEFGRAPWQIDRVEALLTIRNNLALSRATVLDANGMATGLLDVSRRDDVLTVRLPSDALYVIIE
jgi:hypothetical protein